MKKISFLSILILIGLFSSFISFGQNFYGTINNSTTCTVTVTIYDGGGGVLYTGNIGAGTTYVSTYNTCITGNPVTVSFTYSTCTRTLNIGPIPDSEGDVPGYCGFGCGSVQSYFVQRNNASAPSTCSYFVAISII